MPEWDDQETYTEIRYRVNDPKKYDKIRRKEITDGVVMLYGRIKGGDDWEIQALRFVKEKFTLTKAKAWLKEHPDILKDELINRLILINADKTVTWGNIRLDGTFSMFKEYDLESADSADLTELFQSDGELPEGMGRDTMRGELDASKLVETDDLVTIPAVFTKEGVMNGGFKPKDEIKKAARFANGRPFVLDHLESWELKDWLDYKRIRGFTSDAKYVKNGHKISGNVNVYKSEDNAQMITEIKSGERTDVSIEFLFKRDAKKGDYNGTPYDYVERNIQIMTLATVDAGACSPEDGCGLGLNKESETMGKGNEDQDVTDSVGDLSLDALIEKNKLVAELKKSYDALKADHTKLEDEHKTLTEENKKVVAERDGHKERIDGIEKEEKDALVKELIEKDPKRKEDYEKNEMSLDELKERSEIVNDLINSAHGDKSLRSAGATEGGSDSELSVGSWDHDKKEWVT